MIKPVIKNISVIILTTYNKMEQLKHNEEFRLRVITEINQVRTNPQKYAEKIRKYASYFKGKVLKVPEIIPIMTAEGPAAFEEAASFLDNLDKLDPLKYSPGLTHIAHDILTDIQKYDNIDELNDMKLDSYINKHGQIVGHLAEAVDFGSSLAELVVINLLVDDGDLTRGNRANIINPKYKIVGVSTGIHPVYHNSTVVIYCRHFYALNEEVGDLSDDNYEPASERRKMSVVRRSSLGKQYVYVDDKETANSNVNLNTKSKTPDVDDDFDLPEGVSKIERQEKIVEEKGVKKKIVKVTKHMEDGSIVTEIFKEKI
jgi:hypothetical protein